MINNIEVKDEIVLNSKQILIEDYSHLILNENKTTAVTKKNLSRELKKNFPNVKFSIVKQYSDCYYVSWHEGINIKEADDVLNKFVDHKNDESGDFRDYSPSDFNLLFGGFKYIFTTRTYSLSKQILLNQLGDILGDNKIYPNNVTDALYQLLNRTSFPSNYDLENLKINTNESIIHTDFSVSF